jgi:two-component system cell cycle sensor histidine kinase/response regulator CckA
METTETDRTISCPAGQGALVGDVSCQELFEQAMDMIAVLDREGCFVEINRAGLRRLGYERDELVGRPMTLILAPEEREAAAGRLARKVDGLETAALYESVLLARDGRRVPTEVSSQVIVRDELPVGVLVIARDVSEQVAARAALEESERRFVGVFDGVAVGMALTDRAGTLLRVNAAYAEMLGYSPSELTGVPVRQLLHPDDRAVLTADHEKLRGRLGPRRVVADRRYLRKDGETIFVHVSVSAVRADDGSTQFLAAQVEDVTELQRVQAALEESQALHRVVVENSHDVLAVLDLDGTIRLVSPSIQASLGYSEQELVGRNLVELLHPADRQAAQAAFEAASGGRVGLLRRLQVVAKSGSVRLWEGTVAPGAVNGNELTFLVTNARDVTDRVQLEDQLLHAQKMESVGRLAGGVAHDFNNLLTAIRGYAELGLRKLGGGDGSEEIGGVIAAAEKATSLTAQLLAFSRRQVLSPETFDLGDVAADMVKLLRRMIPENVELTAVLADEPTLIHADRTQIEQVIANLVVNARDAIRDRGHLSIEVARAADDKQARLIVRDDGIGMDATTAAQIFEPFFTTKGVGEGTGLGLSMVHGIISQSDGQIAVESEPGQGTTFTITLPLADGVVALPEPITLAPAAGGTETILLVEDDPVVRAVVTDMLDQRGYRLVTAGGGEEALALAHASPGTVDLLITDLMMGGLNGRETAEAVREHQPQAKVLYMSGYTDDAVIRVDGHELGISFLQKPFSGEELGRRVRELLDSNAA